MISGRRAGEPARHSTRQCAMQDAPTRHSMYAECAMIHVTCAPVDSPVDQLRTGVVWLSPPLAQLMPVGWATV